MKKSNFKEKKKLNPMFTFVLGMALTATTVFAATGIFASDVGFSPVSGLTSTNVQAAIDEVYAETVDYSELKKDKDNYYKIAILQGTDRTVFKQNVNYTTLTYIVPFHGETGSSAVCSDVDNNNQCTFTISHNQGNGDSTGRWVSPIDLGSGLGYYVDTDATLTSYYCRYKVSAKIEDIGAQLKIRLYKNTIKLVDNVGTGSTEPDDAFCSANAEQTFRKYSFILSTTYLNNLELNDIESE